MADFTIGTTPNDMFVDKRRGRGGTGANVATEVGNMSSVSVMRTRLAALNAGLYTSAMLNKMTVNDMVFAIRKLSGDNAGV